MDKYIDSARTVQDKDEAIQSLEKRIEERDRAVSSKEEEIQQLKEQLQQERDQASRQLEEKERQLGQVKRHLQEADRVVEQLVIERNKQKPDTSCRGEKLDRLVLKWREEKRAPRSMTRWCDAVVDGCIVYIPDSRITNVIYSYDSTTGSWSPLPKFESQTGDCSVAVINGWLTTVGGINSNELLSLTREGKRREWTKKYPPMPTKRSCTTALCTGTALIVAGGIDLQGGYLSKVEVMNTENHQWYTAADLPQPIYRASATVCGDRIYMMGGGYNYYIGFKAVHTCSVSALLQSCASSSLEAKTSQANVWRQVADLPVTYSTCVSFHGRLLAVGGMDDSGKATTAVYAYNSTTNSWDFVSHMTTGRYHCFTAVLPNNQLMVVGGETDPKTSTDSVELADVN